MTCPPKDPSRPLRLLCLDRFATVPRRCACPRTYGGTDKIPGDPTKGDLPKATIAALLRQGRDALFTPETKNIARATAATLFNNWAGGRLSRRRSARSRQSPRLPATKRSKSPAALCDIGGGLCTQAGAQGFVLSKTKGCGDKGRFIGKGHQTRVIVCVCVCVCGAA